MERFALTNPMKYHVPQLKAVRPAMSFDPSADFDVQMSDMAAMIAPRALIAVNGVHDHLQPFESAKAAFEKVKEIYRAAGAENHCDLVAGPEGHRFYAELAWPVFARYI